MESEKELAGRGTNSSMRNGMSGMRPMDENARNVKSAWKNDFLSVARSLDSSDKKSAEAIENPSDAKFAHPRMITIRGSRPAP
jgi:hypothetical protein